MKKSANLNRITPSGIVLATIIGVTFSASPALAIDWANVPAKDVMLFYPGQASWEWVLTQADHSGAPKFRAGKNCRGCHEGEQADMGALIVSGKKLEPNPIPGKRGSIPLKVKTAYDNDRLYFQFQWKAQELPNIKPMDAANADKITVMIDDGAVVEAARAGCWGACHDDATYMPSNDGKELEKYLARSRVKITRQGGDRNYKPDAELAAMMNNGEYLEYWQADLDPGKPAAAINGYILKDRTEQTPTEAKAVATYDNGTWTVELSRPLHVSDGFYKSIDPGKTYHLGFAIHDAHAAKRFHHVSFEQTLVLDSGDADFVAVKQ